MMEKFLDGRGREVTNDEIYAALRKARLGFKFVPVLCGSAFKNKGVQMLLDAVVNFLPSPLDIPPGQGHDAERRGRRSSSARPTTRSRSRRSRSRS